MIRWEESMNKTDTRRDGALAVQISLIVVLILLVLAIS